jgi:uncharacterized protein YukE
MNVYKTGKMRDCARDIRAELTTYKTAKDAVDELITNLRNNWEDETNTMYSGKYNAEAKVSAENVQGLMKQFVDLLESSADAYDKIHTQAQANMQ